MCIRDRFTVALHPLSQGTLKYTKRSRFPEKVASNPSLSREKSVHDMLRRHPRVESFRLGKYGEGEGGVTVVTLK